MMQFEQKSAWPVFTTEITGDTIGIYVFMFYIHENNWCQKAGWMFGLGDKPRLHAYNYTLELLKVFSSMFVF